MSVTPWMLAWTPTTYNVLSVLLASKSCWNDLKWSQIGQKWPFSGGAIVVSKAM
jgi:hypothetical protein